MRIGHGYDVHRLVEGRKLILGGVEIPWEKGLDGHSDADVLTHAIMDALLGAAAMGDIGKLFPDTDDRFLGICSMELLTEVGSRLRAAGYAVEACALYRRHAEGNCRTASNRRFPRQRQGHDGGASRLHRQRRRDRRARGVPAGGRQGIGAYFPRF